MRYTHAVNSAHNSYMYRFYKQLGSGSSPQSCLHFPGFSLTDKKMLRNIKIFFTIRYFNYSENLKNFLIKHNAMGFLEFSLQG